MLWAIVVHIALCFVALRIAWLTYTRRPTMWWVMTYWFLAALGVIAQIALL